MKAIWNGTVIAESDDTVVVEGNHYFPPQSVDWDHLDRSWMRSLCPWKGIARYYDVVVDGHVNAQAAWYYPHPSRWPAGSKAMSRSGTVSGSK